MFDKFKSITRTPALKTLKRTFEEHQATGITAQSACFSNTIPAFKNFVSSPVKFKTSTEATENFLPPQPKVSPIEGKKIDFGWIESKIQQVEEEDMKMSTKDANLKSKYMSWNKHDNQLIMNSSLPIPSVVSEIYDEEKTKKDGEITFTQGFLNSIGYIYWTI